MSRREYSSSSSSTYTRRTEHRSTSWSSSGKYFEDRGFPATDESLFYSKMPGNRKFEWKRPWEICDNPKFYVDGASRMDNQGILGNCWLLAAMSALTRYKSLLERVITMPDYVADNRDPNYTGRVEFSFWRFGEWKKVEIDDRLPTFRDTLVFVHSEKRNEFWCALAEKAYAKLHGSYEALTGGQTGEAFTDFTGGLSESFVLANAPDDLFKIMQTAESRRALMGCSIDAKPGEIETRADHGLVKGHAYTVTAIRKVSTRHGEVELLRVRNPWGNEKEWTGPWGDSSREWNELSDDEKKEMGLTFEEDGEFWMPFKDFKDHFSKLEICMLPMDYSADGSNVAFNARCEHGSWRGKSAGGCRNFIKTFANNPQFRLTLQDSDDDKDDLCTVIIALMQKDRRRKSHGRPIKNLTIGFSIYKLEEDDLKRFKNRSLDKEYFEYHASTDRSTFINSREVVRRCKLPPGEYDIIPSTFQAKQEAKFLLRIFSEKEHSTRGNEDSTHIGEDIEERPPLRDDEIDDKFSELFETLAGEDGTIDASELRKILCIIFKTEFSVGVARAIVNLYDEDSTGKLDFEEFMEAYIKTKNWMEIWPHHDANGTIHVYELYDILEKAFQNIHLDQDVLQAIYLHFGDVDGNVRLNDYMLIVCRIDKVIDVILRSERDRNGQFVTLPVKETEGTGMLRQDSVEWRVF